MAPANLLLVSYRCPIAFPACQNIHYRIPNRNIENFSPFYIWKLLECSPVLNDPFVDTWLQKFVGQSKYFMLKFLSVCKF